MESVSMVIDTATKFLWMDKKGVSGQTKGEGREQGVQQYLLYATVCVKKGGEYIHIWLFTYRILLEADNIICFQGKELCRPGSG